MTTMGKNAEIDSDSSMGGGREVLGNMWMNLETKQELEMITHAPLVPAPLRRNRRK